MIIVMQQNADEAAVQNVVSNIRQRGLFEHISRGQERIIIGAVGDERVFDVAEMMRLPQVEKAIRIVHDWRLVSREACENDTVIHVRGVSFGGGAHQTVWRIDDRHNRLPESDAAAVLLDPFYLPECPYAFSGSLNELATVQQLSAQIDFWHTQNKVLMVRVRDSKHVQAALNVEADMIYLGGELLNNRYLLREVGCLNVPVIVCKDVHHSVRDWLVAAEQIVLCGNQHVILGEAGTAWALGEGLRLDIDAIVQAKKLSHLPVLANISDLLNAYMDESTLLALAQIVGVDAVVRAA
ncbi:MAG: 3-deoxy-D-arabino-heptulosonate 7-phosphate synthase [Alysiella sp.]|uniref:3-deoxy-D-arabino-heptulosonate 7-phosphate synthase n=1 Tax=Alysiella sp. TaxID=1872483 RepID=UPI0026DD2ABE|nr:3-deoxy-D-arabino-heptulosonate 7-phosphate synthase [Alysiella sp.]MDO4434039.1 3-deoxy-D-arabino-heptulosonate 7-phosphate synthase [Alysiella sp.]